MTEPNQFIKWNNVHELFREALNEGTLFTAALICSGSFYLSYEAGGEALYEPCRHQWSDNSDRVRNMWRLLCEVTVWQSDSIPAGGMWFWWTRWGDNILRWRPRRRCECFWALCVFWHPLVYPTFTPFTKKQHSRLFLTRVLTSSWFLSPSNEIFQTFWL